MKKIIIVLILALIVGVSIFYRIESIKTQELNKREGIESIQMREGFPVRTVPVNVGEFEVWREIPGKVEGYKQAVISTPDAARVAAIRYKVGDHVAADTPIISLDENDPKNISQVKLLRSVYEEALKDYERYDSLYKSGGVSKEIMEKARLNLQTAKTNLDSAQATVHLTSPISGTLMSLYIRVGENAEPGKTLAMVSALDKVRVVAEVSDRDVEELEIGQKAKLVVGGKEYQGEVDRISLGANTKTGLFDLELVIDNSDRQIKAGTYVNAQVRVFYSKDAVSIDSTCLLMDFDGSYFVYQADGNIARKVKVEILTENDDYSVVRGLNSENPVVIDGKSLLRDGVKLRILNAEG